MADSAEPLDTLTQLAQNFPKYATSIARRVVANENLSEEIRHNQYLAQGGVNMVWLNGAIVTEKDMSSFGYALDYNIRLGYGSNSCDCIAAYNQLIETPSQRTERYAIIDISWIHS